MQLQCFFGVLADDLDEGAFIAAVAEAARGIPELPSEITCVFGEPERGVRWFTFVSSAYARSWSMVDEWFVEALGARARTLVVHAADPLTSQRSFQHLEAGKRVRYIVGQASDIAVTGARVPPSRAGRDAIDTGLRAMDWPTDPAWLSLGKDSRRVTLRRAGKWLKRPSVGPGGGRLPSVTVRAGWVPGLDQMPEDAQRLRLDATQLGPAAGADVKRARIHINRSVDLPDLSCTRRFQGEIWLVADHDPEGGWGLRVLDLGGVREMRYASNLTLQGRCERLRGASLESADTISCSHQVALELPRLAKLRRAVLVVGDEDEGADGGPGPLELPALAEVGTLTLVLRGCHPFHVRLPSLRKGKVLIRAQSEPDDAFAASSIELPALAAGAVAWLGKYDREEAIPARYRRLVRTAR